MSTGGASVSDEGLGRALDALIDGANYSGLREVAATLALPDDKRVELLRLLDYAASIAALDAEDWVDFADAPGDLGADASAAAVPQDPEAADRGALESLVPTYSMLLEVIGVRHRQGNITAMLMICHIMSEYFPILAWQSHLGHAADPPRLAAYVGQQGSLWGIDADDKRSRDCTHPLSLRGSLRNAVHIATRNQSWDAEEYARLWRRYLDRDHSRVAEGLAICGRQSAGRPDPLRACERKCPVGASVPGDREALADRLALAAVFTESDLIALRHSAPVGHGFGVPSEAELQHAWKQTWAQLTKPWKGQRRNPLEHATQPGDGEALPGLGALVSAVAGGEVAASGVLAEVDESIRALVGR